MGQLLILSLEGQSSRQPSKRILEIFLVILAFERKTINRRNGASSVEQLDKAFESHFPEQLQVYERRRSWQGWWQWRSHQGCWRFIWRERGCSRGTVLP